MADEPTGENERKALSNLLFNRHMEISDELEIRLFHTLEQVKRMNEAIHRHQNDREPNPFMVQQFREMKSRLTSELQGLLSGITETEWIAQ